MAPKNTLRWRASAILSKAGEQRVRQITLLWALATASGCLWFLACPPYDASWLAWVAAVPGLLAIERAPTLRAALALGAWAGAVESIGGFYWLIECLGRFADFPWIAGAGVLALFAAARSLIFVAYAFVVRELRRGGRVPLALAAPLGMVLGEWAVPQLFPSGQFISQAWHPLVIQVAELTGPAGVTALLMAVNGALLDLGLARRRALAPAALTAAVLAAALVFGAVRMRQVDAAASAAPRLRIGLVQPNVAYRNDGQFSSAEALRELDTLQSETRALERGGAELAVWSEGSYPVTLPRELVHDFGADSAAMIRRDVGIPVLIGADTYDSARELAYNSAWLLDSNGAITGRYDKSRLLAFGEYIPGLHWFPVLRKLIPAGLGRFEPGAGPAAFAFTDPRGHAWRFAPVICYEDILSDYLREVGRERPTLLVNLTVDSWYGARAEPWQHLALAVFGAVELRTPMVRAVNSGVSALIDASGRLRARTEAYDPYVNPRPATGLLVEVAAASGAATPFVSYGEWLAYLCAGLTVLIGWRQRRAAPT